jgi:hypothetical protein
MLEELQVSLASLHRIRGVAFWADTSITAGEKWSDEIDKAIRRAHFFLILLSPRSIASRYIWDVELPVIATRRQACRGLIVPVLLRDCLWEHLELLSPFQAIPNRKDGPWPINLWPSHDQGYTAMARELLVMIDKHGAKKRPRARTKPSAS